MIESFLNLTIFYQLVVAWIALAIVIFPIAIIFKAPYGRHTRKGWGPLMDNKWGWIIMEIPALLVLPMFLFLGPVQQTPASLIIVGLYLLHYFHRVFIYPMRIKTKGKKVPIAIVLFALLFNVINGSILGYHFGYSASLSSAWLFDTRFLIGLALFFLGAYINIRSDSILIGLRTDEERGYKIPRGFLFKYISCPNHFGEIIEWLGFGIMTWALPGFSFAIWTAANLIPRALNHHTWYKDKFDEYPMQRKAVIPFII